MKSLRILLISLVLIMTACSTSGSGGGISVPSNWSLISYGKTGTEAPIVQGSTVTLDFSADGQIGGNGGCNSYGGKYEVQGSKLTISEVISTLMACTDDQVTQQEAQYFKALQGATGFKVSGDSLIIFYDDGQSQLNFVNK